jgi:hypothetical protein
VLKKDPIIEDMLTSFDVSSGSSSVVMGPTQPCIVKRSVALRNLVSGSERLSAYNVWRLST